MASTDATAIPVKNQAYRVTFPIWDADGDLVTGATGLDSEVSKDGGTFADCTNEATEIATSSGMYYLDLTSTEMNADTVAVIVKTSSSGAKTTPLVFYPQEAGDIKVNVTYWNGTAVSSPATAGIPDVNVKNINNVAATSVTTVNANIGTTQPTNFTGTGASALVKGDAVDIAGAAVSTSTAQIGVNVVSVANDAITAAAIATDAIGSAEVSAAAVTKIQAGLSTFAGGAVASVTAPVTVGTNNDKTGYSLSSVGVQAIWDALTSALTTSGSVGKLLVDNINATISSRSSHTAADVWAVATRLLTAGTNIVLAKGTGVTGFNDLTAAQVNAEVVDALTVDTYAEPSGVPAATSSLADKVAWLFTLARNKRTTTSTTDTVRNDADSGTIAASTISDDGTTFTRGEYT